MLFNRTDALRDDITDLETATAGLSAAELAVLDGVVAGTQAAGLAVVANADVNTGVSKVTALHIGATGSETEVTSTAAELNILDGVTSTAAELNALDGITSTVTELNLLDGVTSTTAELNILDGVTSTAAELNILDGVTSTAAELNILDGVTATAAELTRANDLSTRLVALTATAAITEVLHEGRDLYVTGTAAATYTLPEATGSGARFKFIIGQVNTNNNVIVVADTTNANFIGSVNNLDLDAAAQSAFGSPANSDTITLNGTTTGGALGDTIELVDVATDVWCVFGQLQCPTGSNPATCFSAAV